MPCPRLSIPFGAAVAGPKKQTVDSAGQAEKRRLRRVAVETVGPEGAGFLLEGRRPVPQKAGELPTCVRQQRGHRRRRAAESYSCWPR